MKAYWRDDFQEMGAYPCCSEPLKHDEWAYYEFKVLENPCDNFITDYGFNMILEHPYTKRKLFTCSVYFDFKEQSK